MNWRVIWKAALLVLLAANTASGFIKIAASRHRHAGHAALSNADLSLAYQRFRSTVRWESDDAPTHILIARTISMAEANGLPLEPLEGRDPEARFRIGREAVTHGITLNPADAWAWFNLADFHQSFRTGRLRLRRMIRAGEMAVRPTMSPEPVAPPGSEPEDAISVAATLKSLELEPDHFLYRDALAKLYWDRGLEQDAAREVVTSLSAWPRVEIHTILDNDALLYDLSTPVLEGIERSASSPFAGPVMAARARARVLERLDKLGEAVAAWEDLRRLGDKSLEAECDLELGKLELRRQNLDAGLGYLTRAVAEGGDSLYATWALYYMGIIYSQQGNQAEAIKSLRQHLTRAPDSFEGYQALGAELEKTGQSDEAEKVFIVGVRKFPRTPWAYMTVIQQMRAHGRSKQALSYAEGLRKVDPGHEGIDELIQVLREEAVRKTP